MLIRGSELFDLPALYRICLLTGEVGKDATGLYRDPDLLGHFYAGPYAVADPGLSFVAVDDHGVAGYVLGTADTAGFGDWLEAAWRPRLREQYPLSVWGSDPGDGTADWQLVRQLHGEPDDPDEALLRDYPAHLHIDLLPRAQGQGSGRRLIETLTAELRRRGVPGVHVHVSAANIGAIAFYHRVGFRQRAQSAYGFMLGLDLRA